jgi:hypothetical protein
MEADLWSENPKDEYELLLDNIASISEGAAKTIRRLSDKHKSHVHEGKCSGTKSVILDVVRTNLWLPKAMEVQHSLQSITSTIEQLRDEWDTFEHAKKSDQEEHSSRKRKRCVSQEMPHAKRVVSSPRQSSSMPHAKRVVSSPRQSSSMSYYTT